MLQAVFPSDWCKTIADMDYFPPIPSKEKLPETTNDNAHCTYICKLFLEMFSVVVAFILKHLLCNWTDQRNAVLQEALTMKFSGNLPQAIHTPQAAHLLYMYMCICSKMILTPGIKPVIILSWFLLFFCGLCCCFCGFGVHCNCWLLFHRACTVIHENLLKWINLKNIYSRFYATWYFGRQFTSNDYSVNN